MIPILIPPLRERPEDIPILAARFAVRMAAEIGKPIRGLAPEAIDFLQSQPWPGNVRELQHAVERAVIFSSDPVIQVHAFDHVRYGLTPARGSPQIVAEIGPAPATPQASTPVEGNPTERSPQGWPARGGGRIAGSIGATPDKVEVSLSTLNVAEAERALIARALDVSGGHRARAAELLGMSVRTLRSKLNVPAQALDDT